MTAHNCISPVTDVAEKLALRDRIAKAIHARRYQMDAKDTESMFAWYAENPQGTDRSRMAVYAALRDAEAALSVMPTVVQSTWQPIETAPPAGTVIDVWMVLPSGYGARWTGVMWAPNAERWISGPPSQDEKGWKATHWMPLPAPPSPVSSTIWCPGCSRQVDGMCHHFNCAIGPHGLAAHASTDQDTPVSSNLREGK